MRLELESIEFKNFLSYGNVAQKLDFLEGINLIIGNNTGTGRSNGSGKSSLTEVLPFSWFGKLSRPIRKEDIPNWQNKKNCEVKSTFKKGDNTYTILRSIKPDKLEVYENGSLLPIPSDVRMYQKQLENDILNMDYNMFMYLFYTNLNTNIPLLKMTTAQKRTFLERMFLLDTYTELNTLSNEKIKGLSEKIFKITVTSDQNAKTIKDLEEQNTSLRLKLVDITPYETTLANTIKEYEETKLLVPIDTPDTSDIEILSSEIEDGTAKLNKLNSDKAVLVSETSSLKESVDDLKNRQKEKDNKIKNLQKLLKEFDIIKDITDITKEITELNTQINDGNVVKISLSNDITQITERKRGLEVEYDALKDGKCPTCKQKTTKKFLNDNYVKDINALDIQLSSLGGSFCEMIQNILGNTKKRDELVTEQQKIQEQQKKKDVLDTKIKTLSDEVIPPYDLKEQQININEDKISVLDVESFVLDRELQDKKVTLKEKRDVIEGNNNKKKVVDDLLISIENQKKELELRKNNITEINDIITKNIDKINKLKIDTKASTSSINKLNELIDYLSCLKILCKDENVKQYAISSYISYLTQQTNKYLINAGSTHYIKFDKWLDETILGQGIANASYGNLSGGEARSIDLAIQFAFLDVAKLKTGIFPDILILDEILDSSIDGGGLANILRIIKTSQYEDKSKVFIITHREEISDVDVDNTYKISKKNGFSVLEKL